MVNIEEVIEWIWICLQMDRGVDGQTDRVIDRWTDKVKPIYLTNNCIVSGVSWIDKLYCPKLNTYIGLKPCGVYYIEGGGGGGHEYMHVISVIIGSDNILSLAKCQVIICKNVGSFFTGPLGMNLDCYEYTIIHLRICIWKWHLQNDSHFVQASMY